MILDGPFVFKERIISATLLFDTNIFEQEDELNLLHDFTVYASLSIIVHFLGSSTQWFAEATNKRY